MNAPTASAAPTLSKFQSFTMARMPRSAIATHPRNPRKITEGAKKKLRAKMKQVGLLQPIVFNRTTGRLLSGHQRLSVMDSLEGKSDYALDVAVVDLPEKAETEMLVFLNNQSAMGEWDSNILKGLGDLGDLTSFEGMGFDRVDLEIMFDDIPAGKMAGSAADAFRLDTPPQRSQSVETGGPGGRHGGGNGATPDHPDRQPGEVTDGSGPDDQASPDGPETGDRGPSTSSTGQPDPADQQQKIQAMREAKAKAREKFKDQNNGDWYVTIVCRDAAEKQRLMRLIGEPDDEDMIGPGRLFERLPQV